MFSFSLALQALQKVHVAVWPGVRSRKGRTRPVQSSRAQPPAPPRQEAGDQPQKHETPPLDSGAPPVQNILGRPPE